MLSWLPQDDALRSLLAGAAYMLLWLAGGWVAWGAAHGLSRLSSPAAIRLRCWRGWHPIGRGLSLTWALAFPFVLVLEGIFSADDVGLRAVDWSVALPWVLVVSTGAALWLALLWGSYWWRRRNATDAWRDMYGHWTDTLFVALGHEGSAATFRAALIPLAGPYWGVWLAAFWKLLASRASPWLSTRLHCPGQREIVYLEWALDWVGAILYFLSKSVWAALYGRALGQASVLAVTWLILGRPGRRGQLVGLANKQGQGD